MNISQVAAALRRKADAIKQRTRDAEADNARRLLDIARAYSSGPFSTRQLRQMGHPYARRNPRPPGNPAVVNRQTGLFRASWRLVKTANGWRVENLAPYARYFNDKGTRRMIRRPIMRAIGQKARLLRVRALAEAVRRGLDA